MNLFSVCYTRFHKTVRGLGIFLFIIILVMLVYGILFLNPVSVLYVYHWSGVLVLLLVWAGLAFLELLIIRKQFVHRNDKVLAEFLVQTSSHLLKKDQKLVSELVSELVSDSNLKTESKKK